RSRACADSSAAAPLRNDKIQRIGQDEAAGLLPAASFCDGPELNCCQHPPKRSLDGAPNSSRILTHVNRCVEMASLGRRPRFIFRCEPLANDHQPAVSQQLPANNYQPTTTSQRLPANDYQPTADG